MEQVAETVAEAITALGGTKAVSDLLGRRQQAVSNWRNAGFPANTYLVLSAALKDVGWAAPPSLWGMAEPAPATTAPEASVSTRPVHPRKRRAA